MKKIFALLIVFFFVLSLTPKSAEAKSYGIRHYSSGGSLYLQKGYIRKSTGTYVAPYLKTRPDNTIYNNRKYILGY